MHKKNPRPAARRRRLSPQVIAACVAGTAMVAASIAIAPRVIGPAPVQPAADTQGTDSQQVGYGYHTKVDTDPNATAPSGVQGFDIDYYHPVTDWTAVHQSGYQFAYVEAADGDTRNTNFDGEYSGIAHHGLLRGAYFFARPSEDPTGVRQADAFLSEINYQEDGQTLPPVLDVEEASCDPTNPQDPLNQQLAGYVRAFVQEVKSKTGVDPMIYTNQDTWTTCMSNSTEFNGHGLWIAQTLTPNPPLYGGWNTYAFWQWSSNATVNGVTPATPMDADVFNGSLDDLRALAPTGRSEAAYETCLRNASPAECADLKP